MEERKRAGGIIWESPRIAYFRIVRRDAGEGAHAGLRGAASGADDRNAFLHALLGASRHSRMRGAGSACPHLFLPVNLLPEELRATSSRALWIPTAVALALVVVAGVAWWPIAMKTALSAVAERADCGD